MGVKRDLVRGEALRTHHQAFSVGFKTIRRHRSYERYSDQAVPTAAVCTVRAHSYNANCACCILLWRLLRKLLHNLLPSPIHFSYCFVARAS
jgi:hypothetical protein